MRHRHKHRIAAGRSYVVRNTCYAGFLAALVLPTRSASTQTRQVISGEPRGQFRVEFEPVSRLGALSDPSSAQYFVRVVQDKAGSFYVAPSFGLSEVLMYDASGRFVRPIGRRGRGPGEFTFVRHMAVSPNDHIHTIDTPNRYAHWSPGMTSVIGTAIIPFRIADWLFLEDSLFVAQAAATSSTGSTLYLVRLVNGDIEEVELAVHDAESNLVAYERRIGRAPTGFLTVWLNRYRIERWDHRGHLLTVLDRETAWFPPRSPERLNPGSPTIARPEPMLVAASEDTSGRIWTIVQNADPEWKGLPSHPRGILLHPDTLLALGVSIHDFYESTVEVIDVNSRDVVASGSHDAMILGFVDGTSDLVYTTNTTLEGNVVVDIVRLSLQPELSERRVR